MPVPDLDAMTAAELEEFCRKAKQRPRDVTTIRRSKLPHDGYGHNVSFSISHALVDEIFTEYMPFKVYATWCLWQYAECRRTALGCRSSKLRQYQTSRAESFYQRLPDYAKFRENLNVLEMVKPGREFRPKPIRGGRRFYR